MDRTFRNDSNPQSPKILFIGIPYSSHNLSWIGMLPEKEFSIRFFGVENGFPDSDWPYKTYIISRDLPTNLNPANRCTFYPTPLEWQAYNETLARTPDEKKAAVPVPQKQAESTLEWLAHIIEVWEPDIIHTLGIDPASFFYLQARDQFRIGHIGRWVVQSRGRLDLLYHETDPNAAEKIERVLAECDQFVADNPISYQLAAQFGLAPEKAASLQIIPGSGGVEIAKVREQWNDLPSKRTRTIIWPKAYDSIASRVLPIFEAIKLCWADIQPCEILIFPELNSDSSFWFKLLPAEIKEHCHISRSVSRDEILNTMAKSRVMLAPSLTDGVPNVLYEAMAAGAFPIVSPLETLMPLFQEEKNVLYARNLYPQEIAAALIRAMNDDALVDWAAEENLKRVAQIADRPTNAVRVRRYYQELATCQRELTIHQKESRVLLMAKNLEKRMADLEALEKEHLQKVADLEHASHQMENAYQQKLAALENEYQQQSRDFETRYQKMANDMAERETAYQQRIAELLNNQNWMIEVSKNPVRRRLLRLLGMPGKH